MYFHYFCLIHSRPYARPHGTQLIRFLLFICHFTIFFFAVAFTVVDHVVGNRLTAKIKWPRKKDEKKKKSKEKLTAANKCGHELNSLCLVDTYAQTHTLN